MENFDLDNVRPELIQSALIEVDNEVYKVIDMNAEFITVSNGNSQKTIGADAWSPLILDGKSFKALGITENTSIKNVRTDVDWVFRQLGGYYYLTINRKNSSAENPVISLPYVHELQEMYYRLTGRFLA